jgi:hypothetical protein
VTPSLEPRASSLRHKVALTSEILVLYLRVRVLLRRRGLEACLVVLRDVAPDAGLTVDPAPTVHLVRAMLRVLRRLPTDTRCLMRSLVLVALLARRGERATLVLGAAVDGGFLAHAWVERDDRPLLDDGAGRFGRLVAL